MNEAHRDHDLPLDQRLVSKNWSVRKGAFEQLMKDLQKAITSEQCIDILELNAPLWPQYLTENVVAVLEAALDCFKEFIQKDKQEGNCISSTEH